MQLGVTEPQLDGFEYAMAREAARLELPILGICRGAQKLNVAGWTRAVAHALGGLPDPAPRFAIRRVTAVSATTQQRRSPGVMRRKMCPIRLTSATRASIRLRLALLVAVSLTATKDGAR